MARKGFLRRITERITSTVEKVTDTVTTTAKKTADTIASPFKKKRTPSKPKPPKKSTTPPKPTPVPKPKPKPSPAIAREMLMVKLQDMYWLQRKWDAAATSKRINAMTDEQVYAALDMTENDIETAVRADPRTSPEWAAPDDPNANILWYHGGEVTIS